MSAEQLLNDLRHHGSSGTVFNPYRNQYALDNLALYLDYMSSVRKPRVLLVGEAPGHRGCAVTGIPFTSGKVFERFDHPLLVTLRGKISLPRVEGENTATMVWEYLSHKGATPLFWNSFPFHPHLEGEPSSNRTPSTDEVKIGARFLRMISDLFRPDTIAAIGGKGLKGMNLAFPGKRISCIRHPSHGGKQDFIKGMNNVF